MVSITDVCAVWPLGWVSIEVEDRRSISPGRLEEVDNVGSVAR